MKTSITAVIAMTTALVSAAPSPAPAATAALPLEALFKRQTECAAINDACLDASSQNTLSGILGAVPVLSAILNGLTATEVTDQLTCCPGSTCSGGTAALPGFLSPVAEVVGFLPYQSCTDN